MARKKQEIENKESTRVHVDRSTLESAIKRVMGAVAKKSTMPILRHIRLTACLRNAMTLAATDLEIRYEVEIVAGVKAAGWDICLPADKLFGAVSSGDEETIIFDLDQMNDRMLIKNGPCHYEIACLPAEEFPGSSDIGATVCVIPPGIIPRLINAVGHGASRDAIKFNLCGIHFRSNADRLEAAATDGHRLSLASITVPSPAEIDRLQPFTLHSRACQLAKALYGAIDFGLEANLVSFELPNSILSARLIEGEYPDVRRVIRTDYTDLIIVDRQKLIDAILACGVMAEDEGRSVKIESRGEELVISALGENGTCTAVIPCSGEEIRNELAMRLNSKYLHQALESLSGDEVWIKYLSENTPLLLFPADMSGFDERIEVLMPMRF